MESVSWMTDYLPVHLLGMALESEVRFGACLMSCPKTDEHVIRIDEPKVFTRLLEFRIVSVLLSTAAFESYLAFYAAKAAKRIEAEEPGLTLHDYLEKRGLTDLIKRLPHRQQRRHELIMEENGERPAARLLTAARLTLEDKLVYWPLLSSGRMISYKDGYVKNMMKVISIRNELLQPDVQTAPEIRRVSCAAEIGKVFLHHEVPRRLTPGKSCSEEYVVESYAQEHFFWELLHLVPARAVQDAIQYLHRLSGSDNHFITALCAARLVDASGRPLTEPVEQYVIEVDLGDPDEGR